MIDVSPRSPLLNARENILKRMLPLFLEFGAGFSFIPRSSRSHQSDPRPGLLLFNRIQRRLVAVEVELGHYTAEHEKRLNTSLRWLDLNERITGEATPIGLVVLSKINSERVILVDIDKRRSGVQIYPGEFPDPVLLAQSLDKVLNGVS